MFREILQDIPFIIQQLIIRNNVTFYISYHFLFRREMLDLNLCSNHYLCQIVVYCTLFMSSLSNSVNSLLSDYEPDRRFCQAGTDHPFIREKSELRRLKSSSPHLE